MVDSLMFPVALSMIAVLAGLLIYYKPPTQQAAPLEKSRLYCDWVLGNTHDSQYYDCGKWVFCDVFDPTGQWLIVPNPYGYCIFPGATWHDRRVRPENLFSLIAETGRPAWV